MMATVLAVMLALLVGHTPAARAAATDIAVSTKVTATFSESLDAGSLSGAGFRLVKRSTGAAVAATATYDAAVRKTTLAPASNLDANPTYDATVSGVRDVAGNALASEMTWPFTTNPDTTAPEVLVTAPANDA